MVSVDANMAEDIIPSDISSKLEIDGKENLAISSPGGDGGALDIIA